jgi:hypothetical protein
VIVERKTGVYSTQAKACWGCLHVGWWAFFLLPTRRREYGWRLELFTPWHRFRWNAGRWAS